MERLILFAIFIPLPAPLLLAHNPGLSSLELKVDESWIEATLTYAFADAEALVLLDANHDGYAVQAEIDAARSPAAMLAKSALELTLEGASLTPSNVAVSVDDQNAVRWTITYGRGPGKSLSVRSPLIGKFARGHRQFLTVKDMLGTVLLERMLDEKSLAVAVDLTEARG